jgi:hypothetical protein
MQKKNSKQIQKQTFDGVEEQHSHSRLNDVLLIRVQFSLVLLMEFFLDFPKTLGASQTSNRGLKSCLYFHTYNFCHFIDLYYLQRDIECFWFSNEKYLWSTKPNSQSSNDGGPFQESPIQNAIQCLNLFTCQHISFNWKTDNRFEIMKEIQFIPVASWSSNVFHGMLRSNSNSSRTNIPDKIPQPIIDIPTEKTTVYLVKKFSVWFFRRIEIPHPRV